MNILMFLMGLAMHTLISNNELELIYSIIYSFWYFYDKVFLPQTIHVYTYKLIREELIRDYWRDWVWTGMGPYSSKIGYQILYLKQKGLLHELCFYEICGLLTLPIHAPKPRKIYLTTL